MNDSSNDVDGTMRRLLQTYYDKTPLSKTLMKHCDISEGNLLKSVGFSSNTY